MRVNNFNDPVSLPDGSLTTLEELGGEALVPATSEKLGGVKIGSGVNVTDDGTISVQSGGLTVEKFQSDSMPKTLNYDGFLAIINHGDATAGNVTVNYPTWGNYTATMQNHNIQIFPIVAGTTVSVINDGGKRNTFFYYH